MQKLDLSNTPNFDNNQAGLDESAQFSQNLNSSVNTDSINQSGSATMNQSQKTLMIIALSLAVIAGTATGYGAYRLKNKNTISGGKNSIQKVATDNIKNGDIFGVHDEKTFADNAQGYLAKGGVDGEGSHQLLRAGGVSQTVYLTSSVTDLDKFVGMEVKVSGETFKGQKAGWLMDVGRVEIINTQAEAPIEE